MIGKVTGSILGDTGWFRITAASYSDVMPDHCFLASAAGQHASIQNGYSCPLFQVCCW